MSAYAEASNLVLFSLRVRIAEVDEVNGELVDWLRTADRVLSVN
jgi:hypothetical protein